MDRLPPGGAPPSKPLEPCRETTDLESGVRDGDLLDLRVWLRLLTCANLIEGRIRGVLRREFATTLPRFDLLAQIDRAPEGQPMRELSRRLMVTNSNISPLVERLVAEGLVERTPAPDDRRVQHLRLTPAGKAALAAMIPPHNACITRSMDGLDRAQAAALYEALGALKRSIRESD